MRIDPIGLGSSNPGVRAFPGAPDIGTQTDFASIMGMQNRVSHAGDGTTSEKARQAAQEFVAKVFIEPMLKQVRDSNHTPPPFGPGPGEKQFGSMIDAQRSIDLVRSASWPIVDRLAADLTRVENTRGNQTGSDQTSRDRAHGPNTYASQT